MTRIAIAVAVARPKISVLCFLGGHKAINKEPGMNDAKNNPQWPFPKIFATSNGGMMKKRGNQPPLRAAPIRIASVTFIVQS